MQVRGNFEETFFAVLRIKKNENIAWKGEDDLKRHIYLSNSNRCKHLEKWKALMSALLAILRCSPECTRSIPIIATNVYTAHCPTQHRRSCGSNALRPVKRIDWFSNSMYCLFRTSFCCNAFALQNQSIRISRAIGRNVRVIGHSLQILYIIVTVYHIFKYIQCRLHTILYADKLQFVLPITSRPTVVFVNTHWTETNCRTAHSFCFQTLSAIDKLSHAVWYER